jgi:hypothetical protein
MEFLQVPEHYITWSLTLREEHRLRVFMNRVLGKMLGSKRAKLRDECIITSFMICTKYYLGDHIKENEMGGTCGTYGRDERYLQDFGGETCEKETTCQT